MATIPQSTQSSVHQRLAGRQRERWPELDHVEVRCRGRFAYVTGHRPDGTTTGTPEDALDTACNLYLAGPTDWL